MGYSRISVLLGPTLTAARTFSTTEAISTMIMTLVAGTLGVDLERSRAICTAFGVWLGLARPACLLFWRCPDFARNPTQNGDEP
jgi:hypothetical protein